MQNPSTPYLLCVSNAKGIDNADTKPQDGTMRMVSSSVFAWAIMASASAISERAYANSRIIVR